MAFKSTVALVDAFIISFVLVVNIQLTMCQKATTLLLRVCFSNQFIDNLIVNYQRISYLIFSLCLNLLAPNKLFFAKTPFTKSNTVKAL